MKIIRIIFVFLFLIDGLFAQQVVLSKDFAIRDFFVKKDSIFFIEKRDVKYYNLKLSNNLENTYFIGGYGLEIFDNSKKNEIITVSNEFNRTVSSLRFYNKSTKKVENVYYYHKGKTIDALIIPELNYAVISTTDNKIIVIDYKSKPTFNIIHTIELSSLSRRIYYKENQLFFITDKGCIFGYDLDKKEKKLIFNCEKIITDFSLFNKYLIYSTIDGEIVNFNLKSKKVKKIKINKNFVLNNIKIEDKKLIFGTFNGDILVLNTIDMNLEEPIKHHNKSVLKILKFDNDFYSSSIDQTIKKWNLNIKT